MNDSFVGVNELTILVATLVITQSFSQARFEMKLDTPELRRPAERLVIVASRMTRTVYFRCLYCRRGIFI